MFDKIRSAVFFGAHTDDEMIAAGTLHRLAKSGVDVTVCAFGPAGTKEDSDGDIKTLLKVVPEFKASNKRMGSKISPWPVSWITPSKTLHERGQAIADGAFRVLQKLKPDLCFILSPDDENPAHAEVGRQCERVMRGRVPYVVRCQFPWNYSIGRANLFVSLSPEDVQCKRDVINCYQSQLWRYNYEEMLLSYARADGLSIKVPYAEKFELLRGVV